MEKKFECGNEVLLRATVCAVHDKESVYDYDVYYLDHDTGEFARISVIEEQLTTAAKAPNIDWQATYNEYSEKAERKFRELDAANKLIDDLKKELAYSEDCRKAAEKKLDNSVDRITRLSKQRDVLTDYIIDLELQLGREKKNG